MDRLNIILKYLPPDIRMAINKLSEYDKNSIQEIRVRINRPLTLTIRGSEYSLTENGNLSFDYSNGIIITINVLDKIFECLCNHSIHSYEDTIKDGYITIESGSRVGIGGTVNVEDGKIISYRNISSLNIRIAREIENCSYEIYKSIYLKNNFPNINVLIVGKVNSGKTTILRDLCRILSENYKVALIDERNELSASFNGVPQNKIGYLTDVLCGHPRHIGIEIALRTLSPQIVFSDEISSHNDAEAIENLYGNGINIIATTHSSNYHELQSKPFLIRLLDKKIFNYIVFIDDKCNIGKIKEILQL